MLPNLVTRHPCRSQQILRMTISLVEGPWLSAPHYLQGFSACMPVPTVWFCGPSSSIKTLMSLSRSSSIYPCDLIEATSGMKPWPRFSGLTVPPLSWYALCWARGGFRIWITHWFLTLAILTLSGNGSSDIGNGIWWPLCDLLRPSERT